MVPNYNPSWGELYIDFSTFILVFSLSESFYAKFHFGFDRHWHHYNQILYVDGFMRQQSQILMPHRRDVYLLQTDNLITCTTYTGLRNQKFKSLKSLAMIQHHIHVILGGLILRLKVCAQQPGGTPLQVVFDHVLSERGDGNLGPPNVAPLNDDVFRLLYHKWWCLPKSITSTTTMMALFTRTWKYAIGFSNIWVLPSYNWWRSSISLS